MTTDGSVSLRTACRVCVSAAAVFALVAVGVTALSLRKDVANGEAHLAALSVDAHETLEQVKTLARQTTITQAEQSLYLQAEQNHVRRVTLPALDASIRQFGGAAQSLSALISNTDIALNRAPDGVLPTLTGVEVGADNAIQAFTQATEPVMREAGDAAHGFEQLVNDESWKRTAANIAAATESGSEAMGHVNGSAADVQQAVHRMTRPAAWWKRIGETLLGGAAKLRVFF